MTILINHGTSITSKFMHALMHIACPKDNKIKSLEIYSNTLTQLKSQSTFKACLSQHIGGEYVKNGHQYKNDLNVILTLTMLIMMKMILILSLLLDLWLGIVNLQYPKHLKNTREELMSIA